MSKRKAKPHRFMPPFKGGERCWVCNESADHDNHKSEEAP